ncbi:J domain-containing protein [Methylobacterium sp. C25]|uniref:J domain-containing protein n=1 Tax=Methylobacterium sp. C25 TaxID=2721622 RepID=UPI001F1A35F6|nr:J domain-containing protein [Methylobacterium sp. C25]MCE4222683.1 J domain-containing protein [Methylobacterium sp. C25]
MLLALGLVALFGFWWLGRSGGRLPAGLTPRRLAGYAAFALAALLAMRGSLLPSALLAGAGLWIVWGGERLAGRLGRLLSELTPRRSARRTASIELDHGSGDGLVLAGPRAGERLSAVPRDDLVAFLALCRGSDPEGAGLLEAYLDRRHPGWRVDAERDLDPRTGRPLDPGAMTQEEAYQILGLERGASLEEVRAAHRTLMKRLHPDQGGSAAFAARVNAARDRLTNRHR